MDLKPKLYWWFTFLCGFQIQLLTMNFEEHTRDEWLCQLILLWFGQVPVVKMAMIETQKHKIKKNTNYSFKGLSKEFQAFKSRWFFVFLILLLETLFSKLHGCSHNYAVNHRLPKECYLRKTKHSNKILLINR